MLDPNSFPEKQITITLPSVAQVLLYDFLINSVRKSKAMNKITENALQMDDLHPEKEMLCDVLSLANFGLGIMSTIFNSGELHSNDTHHFPDAGYSNLK